MTASEADAAARNAAARTGRGCVHQWSAWSFRNARHGYVRRYCRCGAEQHRRAERVPEMAVHLGR